MKRHCCYVDPDNGGCEVDAEFEIKDLGDLRPDTSTTDACETHVGALIGHNEPVIEGCADEWLVTPIAA